MKWLDGGWWDFFLGERMAKESFHCCISYSVRVWVWDGCSFERAQSCTCSFYQPVESSFQHSLNYSVCSFAWPGQAALSAQPSKSSHRPLPSAATQSPDPQSATVPLLIDSQSVTVKGDATEHPPPTLHTHTHPSRPLLPLLVRCPAFIDHKSTSLVALIVNHPQWHYRSARSLGCGPPFSPRPTLQPSCGILIPPPTPDTVLRSLYW